MNSWYSLLLKISRFVNLNLQKLDERQVVPHSALSFESKTKWEKKNLSQQRVDDKNTRETRNFKEREIYPGTKQFLVIPLNLSLGKIEGKKFKFNLAVFGFNGISMNF